MLSQTTVASTLNYSIYEEKRHSRTEVDACVEKPKKWEDILCEPKKKNSRMKLNKIDMRLELI